MSGHREAFARASSPAGATAEEILSRAAQEFDGRIALASSLGMEDQVVTHMAADLGLRLPVFTLDTGRLFPETYDLIARTEARYGLRMRVFVPEAADVERLVSEQGINGFRDNVAARRRCCEVRKLVPLCRALAGLDAWVTGLRRGQSLARGAVEPFERDDANGLVKVNPLWDWTEDGVRAYVAEHGVPVSPLHDRGFASIGCAPCTRAVAPDGDPRSGRWWWERDDHRECGLHARAANGATAHAEEA